MNSNVNVRKLRKRFERAPNRVQKLKQVFEAGYRFREGQTPCADLLSTGEFRSFPLLEVVELTHNTSRFRFALPSGQKLNLPVASCILVKAKIGGEDVIRPYTPTSPSTARGYFDLIIKVYPTGKMSQHIFSLRKGDTLDIKGPFVKMKYPFNKQKIGMVAGGTGITPMAQVLEEIVSNSNDSTEVTLVYASTTPQDIILHKKLKAW
eukprot:72169_1